MKKLLFLFCLLIYPGKEYAQTEHKTQAVICSRFIMLEGDKNYEYLSREFPHFLHLGLKPAIDVNFSYQRFLNDSASRLSINALKQEIMIAARDSNSNTGDYSGQNIQTKKIHNFRALTNTYWDFLVLGYFTEFHGQFKLDIVVLSKNTSDSTTVGMANFKTDFFTSSNMPETFNKLNEKIFIFLSRPQKKGILTLRLVNTLRSQNINANSFDVSAFGNDLLEDTELQKRLNINTKPTLLLNLDDSAMKLASLAKLNKADLLVCMLPWKKNNKQLVIYNRKSNDTLSMKLGELWEKEHSAQFCWLKCALLAAIDTTGSLDTGFVKTAVRELSSADDVMKYKIDGLMSAGQLDKAAFFSYSKLLSDKSGLATWTSRFGNIMGIKGNLYLSEKYLFEATQHSTGSELYLANALFELRYYEDALREYSKFELSHPNEKGLFLKNKAIIYYYLDDAKTASAFFEECAMKYPLDKDVIKFKGLIAYNQNEYEKAIYYFESLPDSLPGFNKKYYLSRSYSSLPKKSDLHKAISYDKYNIDAYEKLLNLYNKELNFTQSDSLITSGIQNYIWSDGMFYTQASELYDSAFYYPKIQQALLYQANHYLNKALTKDTSFSILTLKAILCEMIVRDSALFYFNKAIKANPKSPLGYLNYTEALLMHNNPPAQALHVLEDIVKTDGISENQNKLLYLYLKLCATRLSGPVTDIQKSKKEFDEALTPFYSNWSFAGFEDWVSTSALKPQEKKDLLSYTKLIKAKQRAE